jgi:tRNA(adenine34) deaminase
MRLVVRSSGDGMVSRREWRCTIPAVNYELYMRAALGEAARAASAGERVDGAVAVLGEAMVAHGRAHVVASGDPTAHAVVGALRNAARRMGTPSLAGLTVFVVVEPCAMCVGALIQADADTVVYAVADPEHGACGSVVQLADPDTGKRRLGVVSGILRDEAEELMDDRGLSWSRVPG